MLRVADRAPTREDSLRSVSGEAKTRLTSRGTSLSAAADDTSCAATNVEYFMTSLGIEDPGRGAVYVYM